MDENTSIACPMGALRLRPEREADRDFRFQLFCHSRPDEWAMVRIDPAMREALMRHQFQAQTESYRARFPDARFDIIELAGASVGRIVTDMPGDAVHVVDLAVVPPWRGRGIGTAILQALMAEAASAGVPVRLDVALSNGASMRLYARLGFAVVAQTEIYLSMEWRPAA